MRNEAVIVLWAKSLLNILQEVLLNSSPTISYFKERL